MKPDTEAAEQHFAHLAGEADRTQGIDIAGNMRSLALSVILLAMSERVRLAWFRHEDGLWWCELADLDPEAVREAYVVRRERWLEPDAPEIDLEAADRAARKRWARDAAKKRTRRNKGRKGLDWQ